MKIEGSVAIVTGAAVGMGKGFSVALLNAGASVSFLELISLSQPISYYYAVTTCA